LVRQHYTDWTSIPCHPGTVKCLSVYVRVCKYLWITLRIYFMCFLISQILWMQGMQEKKATYFLAAIRARALRAPLFLGFALFTLYMYIIASRECHDKKRKSVKNPSWGKISTNLDSSFSQRQTEKACLMVMGRYSYSSLFNPKWLTVYRQLAPDSV
jgi:hypothetical protein